MAIHPFSVSHAKGNSLRQYRRSSDRLSCGSPDPHFHSKTTSAGACRLQATSPLLPNRPVLVDPLTLKETVMHHAHSEEQNKEKENHHE